MMESKPIRYNSSERYYREILHNKRDKGIISEIDAEDLNTYITRRVIQDHLSISKRSGIVVSCCTIRNKFLKDKSFRDITDEDWENMVDSLLISDYSVNTKNYYLIAVRQFLLFLIDNKRNTYLTRELVQSVKTLKVPMKTKTDKDLITPEEAVKLINHPTTSKCYSALVAVLYWTGCRIGEALNLKWENVKFKPPVVEIRIPPFKKNPERFVVSAEAMSYLAEWKNSYPKEIEGGSEGSNYVFVTKYRTGEGYVNMRVQPAYNKIKRMGKAILNRDIHPHQFRASDITNKSNAGVSDMVNKMIHWGNVGTQMLRVYSIPSENMIRDELLKNTGLVEVAENEDVSKPIQCPICGKINVGVTHCGNCGTPLTRTAIENKARVDEELARINQSVSVSDMISATAQYFGFSQDEFIDVFQKLLNSKRG